MRQSAQGKGEFGGIAGARFRFGGALRSGLRGANFEIQSKIY